jgi:hypothetical protein
MPLEPQSELILPPDGTTLWRYIDLAKFLLLLETRSLWFSRADQFEDPLEGTLTDAEMEHLRSRDVANPDRQWSFFEGLLRATRHMRATAYVSCWRADEDESMAMWGLYGKGGVTVAVKTTVGNLKQAISESPLRVFLGEVKYLDWRSAYSDNSPLGMCFRKDTSYEYEKEVRAVIWDADRVSRNASDALKAARKLGDYSKAVPDPFLLQKTDGDRGIEVPIDPVNFVTEVVVGPRETESIFRLVKSLLDRYGIGIKITASNRLTPRP